MSPTSAPKPWSQASASPLTHSMSNPSILTVPSVSGRFVSTSGSKNRKRSLGLAIEMEVTDAVARQHLISLVVRHAGEVLLNVLARVWPLARGVGEVGRPQQLVCADALAVAHGD